jgi:decaprenyl-phosphate phosphoribosyltransferase
MAARTYLPGVAGNTGSGFNPAIVQGADVAITDPAVRRRTGTASALLRASRPKQWTKNLLVFSVPAAAGELSDVAILTDAVLAFVAFCFVSSATYLLNDAADVEADRIHPVKRLRPIAAGELSVRAARIAAAVFIVAGLGVALAASPRLLPVIVGYLMLTTAYTRWLKHEPIFDIAAVAAGFFLRAIAAGVASDIFMSRWFMIVAGGGALFLVTGKRYAELVSAGDAASLQRAALKGYTREYLRGILSTTAGVTVLAYCLWAFGLGHPELVAGSAVPFVLGIMRYGLLLEQGHGEEPEEILLHDRTLLGIGAVWLAMVLLGVATS